MKYAPYIRNGSLYLVAPTADDPNPAPECAADPQSIAEYIAGLSGIQQQNAMDAITAIGYTVEFYANSIRVQAPAPKSWIIPAPYRTGRAWKVKVPAGQWMAGIHTFKTKSAAVGFCDAYKSASEKAAA